jgi:hypothetical protein
MRKGMLVTKKAQGKKVSRKKASKKAAAIPEKQWELPASYNAEGTKMATLREVADPNVPTMSLAELTPEQRAELVAKRIEQQRKFQIAMVGAGIVDKERAIAEVKAQSKIGRVLTEIEQRVINNMVEKATKEKAPK